MTQLSSKNNARLRWHLLREGEEGKLKCSVAPILRSRTNSSVSKQKLSKLAWSQILTTIQTSTTTAWVMMKSWANLNLNQRKRKVKRRRRKMPRLLQLLKTLMLPRRSLLNFRQKIQLENTNSVSLTTMQGRISLASQITITHRMENKALTNTCCLILTTTDEEAQKDSRNSASSDYNSF